MKKKVDVGLVSILASFLAPSLGFAGEVGNRSIASEHRAMEVAAPGRTPLSIFDRDGWKVNISGFTELDMIGDSTRSLQETPGGSPIDYSGSDAFKANNGRVQFSMRNSRLAFTLMAPETNGWKTRGYFEFDLLGFEQDATNSTIARAEADYFSAPTLRLRHAYLNAESGDGSFWSGQYWSLFTWKPYYYLSPVQVSPPPAMPYERVAQATLSKVMGDEHKLQMAVSVVRPPQRDASTPRLDAGLRFTTQSRTSGNTGGPTGEAKTQPMSVAVSGTFRDFETPTDGTPTRVSHEFGSAFAVDLNLRSWRRLMAK
jgi:hypothetical protein